MMFLMVASFAAAAPPEELPDAGMTPDSPFYFMDRAFDVFKSAEARADERAAEAVVMAQEGNEKGIEKALNGYNRAMERREKRGQNDAQEAENTATQAANHARIFANLTENVPSQAREQMRQAVSRSAGNMNNALDSLDKSNPGRAREVATETLQSLRGQVPEDANISHALKMVQMNRSEFSKQGMNMSVPDNGNRSVPQSDGSMSGDAIDDHSPEPRDTDDRTADSQHVEIDSDNVSGNDADKQPGGSQID
ncbi:MAG: hypothetical protein ACLFTH_04455 [Candidatus Woesearchaeota archaeon]